MRRIALLSMSAVCVAALPATASAALVQTLNFTPSIAKSGEFQATVQSRAYDDQGAKAPAVTAVVMRLQKGIKINPGVAAVCKVDTLKSTIGHGCKANSLIGSGTAQVDLRPLATEPIDATVKIYNGPKPTTPGGVASIAMWGEAQLSPNVTAGQAFGATFSHDPTGQFDLRMDLKPTNSPFEGVTVSVTEFKATIGKLLVVKKHIKRKVVGKRRTVTVKRKVNWSEPPKTCDKGTWDFQGEFSYETGETLTKTIQVPCASLVKK